MSGRIGIRTGEALVAGGPPFTAAEPEVAIGEMDGPLGSAFANLLGNQVVGHSRVLALLNTDVMVRPATICVSKVTVTDERYTNILMGTVQYATAMGVLDAVRNGDIPKDKANDLGIIVSLWLNPSIVTVEKLIIKPCSTSTAKPRPAPSTRRCRTNRPSTGCSRTRTRSFTSTSRRVSRANSRARLHALTTTRGRIADNLLSARFAKIALTQCLVAPCCTDADPFAPSPRQIELGRPATGRPRSPAGEARRQGYSARSRSMSGRKSCARTLILCSDAMRTRATLALFLAELGAPTPRVIYDDNLYLASPAAIRSVITASASTEPHVLVVGHNPGLHALALELVGHGERKLLSALAQEFPTGALAVFSFQAATWAEIEGSTGNLEHFTTPRRLSA